MASRRNRRRRTRRGGVKNTIKPSRHVGPYTQELNNQGCPAGFMDCFMCGGKCTMETQDYGGGYVYKKCSKCKYEVPY